MCKHKSLIPGFATKAVYVLNGNSNYVLPAATKNWVVLWGYSCCFWVELRVCQTAIRACIVLSDAVYLDVDCKLRPGKQQNQTMEFLSTTSLANEFDIPASELFSKLKSLGWIDRKSDKWILTNLGKQKGGQTRTNPKFGEYIVWPGDISLENNQQTTDKAKLLNATTIGKHFNVSSQRINLIISELGWIEKDVAGWEITKLGKSIGGRQYEHETSGGFYVLWPEGVCKTKDYWRYSKKISLNNQFKLKLL